MNEGMNEWVNDLPKNERMSERVSELLVLTLISAGLIVLPRVTLNLGLSATITSAVKSITLSAIKYTISSAIWPVQPYNQSYRHSNAVLVCSLYSVHVITSSTI
jgi:hypothetical protein